MKATTMMRLATAAMGGDDAAREELRAAGVAVATLGDLWRAQKDAFERMTPAERRADYVETSRELERIVSELPEPEQDDELQLLLMLAGQEAVDIGRS